MARELILLLIAAAVILPSDAISASNVSTCNTNCQKFQDITVNLTVSLLKKDTEHVATFENQLETMISEMYQGNHTNTRQILKLLSSSLCTVYGNGLSGLFQEMKKHNQQNSPEALFFSSFMQQLDCLSSNKFNESIASITPNVTKEDVLDQWAVSIQNGTYDHIHSFAESAAHMNNSFISWQIADIVRRAFNETTSSFLATLEFVIDANTFQDVAMGYLTLAQELTKVGQNHSEEMLLLGYCVHLTMTNNSEVIEADSELENLFVSVKDEIPSAIRDIFWNSTCTIKNLLYGEYLVASRTPKYGGNGGVYTWVSGLRHSADEWILEPDLVDDHLYFYVNNKNITDDDNNYYLTETLKGSTRNYRQVTTKSDKLASTKWILLPTSWNGTGTAMKIQNVGNSSGKQRFLQAAPVKSSRREVRDSSAESDSMYWEIQCA